jgi:hypothetical protein
MASVSVPHHGHDQFHAGFFRYTVIDFSSGPVAHGQWKLIQISDFCQIFSIESI